MAKRPFGQLRLSQVVTTFGPGALLDLPEQAVIVAGLEEWDTNGRRVIVEPRLSEKVRARQ
jgi:hypothetical protein